MLIRRENTPIAHGDPFALLRRMTTEFDRLFDEPMFAGFRLPALRRGELDEKIEWTPRIEVFEKDNRLVTRVDLPGMKKEDVKVEVTDGQLAISGTRIRETEEKQDQFYRSEREYGHFYRAVPLPEGVGLDDVKATYNNGVLDVSIPMPAKPEAQKPHQVKIEDTIATTASRTAA